MANDFIKMTKDGETIDVHPLAVENHKQLGWVVVEPEKQPPAEEQPAAAEPMETGKTSTGRGKSKAS